MWDILGIKRRCVRRTELYNTTQIYLVEEFVMKNFFRKAKEKGE